MSEMNDNNIKCNNKNNIFYLFYYKIFFFNLMSHFLYKYKEQFKELKFKILI